MIEIAMIGQTVQSFHSKLCHVRIISDVENLMTIDKTTVVEGSCLPVLWKWPRLFTAEDDIEVMLFKAKHIILFSFSIIIKSVQTSFYSLMIGRPFRCLV